MDNLLIGWLFVAGSIISWSIAPSLVALERGKYNSIVANAARSLYASLFLLPYALLHLSELTPYNLGIAALVGFCGAVIGDTLYVASLRTASPGLVIPVSYTYVVVAQIIGFAIGSGVGWNDIAASLIAIAGIYIAYRREADGRASLRGLLYASGASVSWGVFVHLVKYGVSLMDPLLLNFTRLLIAGIILYTISSIVYGLGETNRAMVRFRYTSLSGVVGFGIGGSFFYLSLTTLRFSPVIVATALTPLTAVFTARLMLGEEVKARHFIGAAVVVVAIILTNLS